VDKIRQFDISSELFSFATEEPLLFWKNLHVRTSELKKEKKRLIKKREPDLNMALSILHSKGINIRNPFVASWSEGVHAPGIYCRP
jgi:hypothetical protein